MIAAVVQLLLKYSFIARQFYSYVNELNAPVSMVTFAPQTG